MHRMYQFFVNILYPLSYLIYYKKFIVLQDGTLGVRYSLLSVSSIASFEISILNSQCHSPYNFPINLFIYKYF